MPSIDRMVASEVRKFARQGRLIDEAFKIFQRMVYPGAPQDEVAALRIAFFAGAAEISACMMYGLADGEDATPEDEAFMAAWMEEIDQFHRRTLAAMTAGQGGKADA